MRKVRNVITGVFILFAFVFLVTYLSIDQIKKTSIVPVSEEVEKTNEKVEEMFVGEAFQVNSAEESSVGGVNEEKLATEQTLTVSIITDIDHCPSRSPASEKQIDQFISFSKGESIDFVISLGDNASHRLRNCSETADQDARFIATKLRTINKPCYFVLGDHDIASSPASYQEWLKTIDMDRTYFSFDSADVHVVVLDSVLGGEQLSPPCEEIESCSKLQKRLEDLSSLSFIDYKLSYQNSLGNQKAEKKKLKSLLEIRLSTIKETRSAGRRDRGRISQTELAWLKNDISKTKLDKILVFSDHPLFAFTSERKFYNIVNGEEARTILEKSNKQIVCISGEAHLWHENNINGIQYYIVDELKKANGSWAKFTWDKSGYALEKITHQ